MIGSEEIESKDQVKLVGVLIYNKLSYSEYISSCLKQASSKMNSIERLPSRIISYKKIKRKYYATRTFYHTSNIVPSYGTLEILATFTRLKNFMKE